MLAQRYASGGIAGLDSSPDMIDDARARLHSLQFELADIADWQAAQTVDVILANASLQWLNDHSTLYPRLVEQVKVGG